jgi:hypothetical protein
MGIIIGSTLVIIILLLLFFGVQFIRKHWRATGSQKKPLDTHWMPKVAGIINVVAGSSALILALVFIMGGLIDIRNPSTDLPGFEFFAIFLGVVLLPLGILTFIGGIYALQRKHWKRAMLFPLALVFVIGITLPSIIMINLSMQEFND